jgi:hypothetical protein
MAGIRPELKTPEARERIELARRLWAIWAATGLQIIELDRRLGYKSQDGKTTRRVLSGERFPKPAFMHRLLVFMRDTGMDGGDELKAFYEGTRFHEGPLEIPEVDAMSEHFGIPVRGRTASAPSMASVPEEPRPTSAPSRPGALRRLRPSLVLAALLLVALVVLPVALDGDDRRPERPAVPALADAAVTAPAAKTRISSLVVNTGSLFADESDRDRPEGDHSNRLPRRRGGSATVDPPPSATLVPAPAPTPHPVKPPVGSAAADAGRGSDNGGSAGGSDDGGDEVGGPAPS